MTGQDSKPMPECRELMPDELNQVSGGVVCITAAAIVVTKDTDSASPLAFVAGPFPLAFLGPNVG